MQEIREGRYPTDMAGFLSVMDDARASLERVIEGRSQRELTDLRDHAGWSVKDHLVHLAVWERGMTWLLRRRPRHEGMGLSEDVFRSQDVDAINDDIFVRHRDLSLDQSLDMFRAAHQEMLALLSTLTWDDLQRPYGHFASNDQVEAPDQPVLHRVFDNTAGHFDEHQPWIEAILRSG
jgi:hypothetical protein